MLQSKNKLEETLQRAIVNLDDRKEVLKKLLDKYNFPIDFSSDVLTFRKRIGELDAFQLFVFTDILVPRVLEKYFSPDEIKMFKNDKWENKKKPNVLRFKALEVDGEHWIGISDVKSLMELRDFQLIHYNGDTQRALKQVIRDGNIILQPYLNNTAVNEICELYKSNKFIPNTITLNMPEDVDYKYIKGSSELEIYDLDHFDITDGYHRYVAMGNVYDNVEGFNYPIELRITKFSEEHARQFIYQEEKKKKMRRIDANYMNRYDYGNTIVRKLNDKSNLANQINNANGYIEAPYLALCINRIWKPNDNKDAVVYAAEIRKALDEFTEEYTDYLGRSWERREILCIFYGFFRKLTPKQNVDLLTYISEHYPEIDNKSIVRKKYIDILEKEVRRYV